MDTGGSLSTTAKVALGGIIIILALLLLAGGGIIPFKFESFSILYKFGMDKAFLRSGKVIGITIVVLVFFQCILASRFTVLEQIFSLKRLLFLHRISGIAISVLVILHPLLIKASENFTAYTFAKKYYPEFMGIALLTLLLVLISTAVFKNLFNFSYTRWLLQHRCCATLVLFLMPTHILWVSETFKSGPPRTAALIIFCLCLLLLARIWQRRMQQKAK